MASNQQQYMGCAEPFPPHQNLYPPKHISSQYLPSAHNSFQKQDSPIQQQYGQPIIAEPPTTFIAELPAALPEAPPTTTSAEQLNADELLAHRLQNLEVQEARRRSSSLVSHRSSNYSLRDASSLAPRISQGQMEAPPPTLPSRPHSRSVTSAPYYGPDSFGPPPASFETATDGRALMAQPGLRGQSRPTTQLSNLPEVFIPPQSLPEVVPPSQSLPEVVLPPHPISATGLELVPTTSNTSSMAPPTYSPMNPLSLASYLEAHRQVQYPPQWQLPPVLDTLYSSSTKEQKATDWLDPPHKRQWRRIRSSQHALATSKPTYSFTFQSRSASLFDARYSWSMYPEPWTYNLRLDARTGIRNSEVLMPPNGAGLITTYIKGQNYDSLRFMGQDGSVYLWVAHAPLSSVPGTRYDTLRHALFMAPKGCDPLYGQIVADHAYWDGFIDYSEVHRVTCAGCGASPINGLCWKCKSCEEHEICEQCRLANRSVNSTCSFTLANLPDEALYIRSSMVDPALICATLEVMRQWEFHMLRVQKSRDPKIFKMSEDRARQGELGKLSHWKAGDSLSRSASAVQDPAKLVKDPKEEKAKAKEREKLEKAKEKEKAKELKERKKEKKMNKRGSIIGIGELIRGSAQVGGSVGDVGEALRRRSKDSVRA